MTHTGVDSFRRCFPRFPGYFSTLFNIIDDAFKDDIAAASKRYDEFIKRIDSPDKLVSTKITAPVTPSTQAVNNFTWL